MFFLKRYYAYILSMIFSAFFWRTTSILLQVSSSECYFCSIHCHIFFNGNPIDPHPAGNKFNRLLLMCFQVCLYGVDMLKYRSVCVLIVEIFLNWRIAIAREPSLSGYQFLTVKINEWINLFQRPPLEFGSDMPIPISATITAKLPAAFHCHAAD